MCCTFHWPTGSSCYVHEERVCGQTATQVKRTRVLHVVGELGVGGGESVLCALVERMDHSTFDVLVCPLWPILDLAPRIETAGARLVPIFKRHRYDLSIIPRLGTFIARQRIDIVHTWMGTANIWGRLAAFWGRAPVTLTAEHGMWSNRDCQPRTLERLLLPLADRIVVVSKGVEDSYCSAVPNSRGKCCLIYNGVDLARFDRGRLETESLALARKFGLDGKHPIVGTVANYRPEKDYPNFLATARIISQQYPAARFVAVGDGKLRPEIERTIQALGLAGKVTLTGTIECPERIATLFDVFVLASETEGLPPYALT
jgi:glycosyltransferase involved in cell wall biosynthesis